MLKQIHQSSIKSSFEKTRKFSLEISQMLSEEEQQVQSMENASPIKWHLAHTTWFFETLILQAFYPNYKIFHPKINTFYNSYYNSLGKLFPRHKRGMITRPNLKTILAYRQHVDEKLIGLIEKENALNPRIQYLLQLGIHHEQQHQELMITDIKHVFSFNPLYPSLFRDMPQKEVVSFDQDWLTIEEGIYSIGTNKQEQDFFYDNEFPKHKIYLHPFKISTKLVTNSEYLEFIEDGCYSNPLLWLSEGWTFINNHHFQHPLYWIKKENQWYQYTLNGLEKLNPDDCITHVNYYEANAYANWKGYRLPTEAEWETAARQLILEDTLTGRGDGNFQEKKIFQPYLTKNEKHQFFGNAWEWTSSSYTPYPGFKAEIGAIGEYNGKFMCNQYVLKGGSCATTQNHIRTSYRNFFSANSSWQFTSIRLSHNLPF